MSVFSPLNNKSYLELGNAFLNFQGKVDMFSYKFSFDAILEPSGSQETILPPKDI